MTRFFRPALSNLAGVALCAAAALAAPAVHAHGSGHEDHGSPATPAAAAPVHAHAGHGAAAAQPVQTPWGKAGAPQAARRTVTIRMDDQMRFSPSRLRVKLGETVRLVVRNQGRLQHELVLGTRESIQQHAQLMAQQPDMPHGGADMAHVSPGQNGEIVWTFNRAGTVHFACLVDGHHLAGMVGTIEVVR